jgi:hypothetical protein
VEANIFDVKTNEMKGNDSMPSITEATCIEGSYDAYPEGNLEEKMAPIGTQSSISVDQRSLPVENDNLQTGNILAFITPDSKTNSTRKRVSSNISAPKRLDVLYPSERTESRVCKRLRKFGESLSQYHNFKWHRSYLFIAYFTSVMF